MVTLNKLLVVVAIKPPGGLFISSPFEGEGGGLIGMGAYLRGGGLFNLKTTMVSVLRKELEYKVVKLKYKTF